MAMCCLICLPLTVSADPDGPVRVLDADTWDVGATRVRLFGIDAPEKDQTCKTAQGSVWSCGAWATSQVRDRYQGRIASCEALDTDRYGRTVARCTVDGRDVGRALVTDGLAFAYRRYSMDYDLDEKGAAIRAAGLWGSEVQAPAAFRASRTAPPAPDPACPIKGNISSKGKRIYHSPGQADYDRTRINPSKGERWFCSADAARAAGWRPARR